MRSAFYIGKSLIFYRIIYVLNDGLEHLIKRPIMKKYRSKLCYQQCPYVRVILKKSKRSVIKLKASYLKSICPPRTKMQVFTTNYVI